MRWIVSLAVVVVVLGWGQVAQASTCASHPELRDAA